MSVQYTIEQLTDWIVRWRRNKAFCDSNKEDIALDLLERCQNNNMYYATDPFTDSLCGVVTFHELQHEKTIVVDNLLASRTGIMKQFIRKFLVNYPGYSIESHTRKGFMKRYHTPRLIQLILNLT